MKFIEIRKHSIAGHDGKITKEGIDLATLTKETLYRPFARVITSPASIAVQTAEIFGYSQPEVDIRLQSNLQGEAFSQYIERIEWFALKGLDLLEAYFSIPEITILLEKEGNRMLDALRDISKGMGDGSSILIISHSGVIETAVLVAIGGLFELEGIGGKIGYCEGIRFGIREEEIVMVEIIRLIQGK